MIDYPEILLDDLDELDPEAPPGFIQKPDVKLCNCTGCGQELLGASMPTNKALLPKRFLHTPHVHQRFQERPYCRGCWEALKIQ